MKKFDAIEIKKQYIEDLIEQREKLNHLFSSAPHDRMFAYLWYEMGDLSVNDNDKIQGECKFGEHYLNKNEDPISNISSYVRSSLARRKDKWDDGSVKLLWIWDITDYAVKFNKLYVHSKVDDHIREQIGFVKQGEVHSLDPLMMMDKVNALLKKHNQALPMVSLKSCQMRALIDACDMYANKKIRVLLADLYARFGKTIWSSALSTELDWKLTIISSYVKTSFASFKNDISSFQQFKDIVQIDAENANYKKLVNNALKEEKRIFVFISLCNGTKREERIKFLLSQKVSTGLIIDEADFGAHRKKQAEPLINAFNKNENIKVVIMTGTNADRAASEWPIDNFISETYYESLVDKYNVEKI